MTAPTPIMRLSGLTKTFRVGPRAFLKRSQRLHALTDVSLDIESGQTLGIVGESGCGKSTLARIVVGLTYPDAGRIEFDGKDITGQRRRPLEVTRSIQMVFQDPYSALNPRSTIGDAILEPLLVHQMVPPAEARAERDRLMDKVGLSASLAGRLPNELSGGQRQRVNIARALSVRPRVLIADEAVASLDVSVRAQILNLFADLRDELGLTLVFISHDLSVVDHLCDRVAVMYLGRVVEEGPAGVLTGGGAHHYTSGLVAAIPKPVPGRRNDQPAVRGELPSSINPPTGCSFRTRCPAARAICAEQPPASQPVGRDHNVACHFPILAPAVPVANSMVQT